MKQISLHLGLSILCFCLITSPGLSQCPEYTFIKIVDTDTPVPGGNGGTFDGLKLSMPTVNNLEVAFRGVGGGEEGFFVGDGKTLTPKAVIGDSLDGGGTISDIFEDFAFSGDVFDIIVLPSNNPRGIYSTSGSVFSKTVELGDPAPAGGTFSTIFYVSRHEENLAFQANVFRASLPGASGVFTRIAGVNEVVADQTTVMPGSDPITFSGFSDPDISSQKVAFKGGNGALTGVFARIDGNLLKVADTNDTQPGGVKSFTTFSVPVISGRKVAFRGLADDVGIFVGDGGPLDTIVKAGDPAPEGGTFSGFGPNVSADNDEVAFSGAGSGFIGLFVAEPSGLCRVIDTNDTLEGEDVTQLFMGRDSYSEGMLAFQAVFFDGRRGIYLAKVSQRAEIIGTWNNGIWYHDVIASTWTEMTPFSTSGDIASGDFNGDGKADVASIWSDGLWVQDGATLDWTKIDNSPPNQVTAGDITGDGRDEIIGSWSSGIWYWDPVTSNWTSMTPFTTSGDIAAGDFNGDGKADVASIWSDGLWVQDGATLDWTKIDNSLLNKVTAGDITGDGRDEIIGSWNSGISYWDPVTSNWTSMTPFTTTGDIAAGDFNGDGKADVASIWSDGLWVQDGATLAWNKIDNLPPNSLTAGDITGD